MNNWETVKTNFNELKNKSDKQLYLWLIHQDFHKEQIIELLSLCDIKIDKKLSLKKMVELYHNEICEVVFEEIGNALY